MTPRSFRFAMGEASTMLQPPPAELYRNGLDLNRRTLDLNAHAFDFSDFGFLQAHRASAFFDASAFAPDSSSYPYFPHLPFAPPPPASDFWHQQVREYWSRSLPSWQELFYSFAKQEPPQNLPKQQPRIFQKQDQAAAIVSAEAHTSIAPDKSDNLLPLSSDASPKPSQDLYAKYLIESPTWLPLGWITEVQTRRTGTTAGTRDKYYKDPVSGRRFRSRNEVLHFLETGKGRVRRRYKRRIMDSESTTDTACVITKVPSPAVKVDITETECQRMSSPAYSRTLDLHSGDKDSSFKSLSVAFTIPPAKEKLPQEWPRPSSFAGSSAPETSANCLPPKGPKTCLKAPAISRKRCPQDRPQKPPVKKKVRFESPRKGVERQDSRLWQWLQKPVGLQDATRNEHQEKNLEQKSEVMEATMVSKIERPKEAGRVVEVGILRKNVRVAIDDELSKLIRQPGLTSRQRARLVQKFKARRAKQLLAILGRKICCQLLGLPAR